ncbi:hypothetical protein J6590_048835 [Homalodisca vitripennis]|nr:hypothetical protein J6590_048835 [Homalodisca vitripennis]
MCLVEAICHPERHGRRTSTALASLSINTPYCWHLCCVIPSVVRVLYVTPVCVSGGVHIRVYAVSVYRKHVSQ